MNIQKHKKILSKNQLKNGQDLKKIMSFLQEYKINHSKAEFLNLQIDSAIKESIDKFNEKEYLINIKKDFLINNQSQNRINFSL